MLLLFILVYAAIWNLRLREAVDRAPLTDAVFAAMNTCIDVRAYVNKPRLQTILDEDPNRADRVLRRLGEDVTEIRNLDDFLVALLHSFNQGKALQVPTRSVEVLKQLDRIFEQGDYRTLGGQSAIIATLLARLGIKYSLVYSPLLPPKQAELMQAPGVYVPINRDGHLHLVTPLAAANENQELKVNWIFEFREGATLYIKGKKFTAPRSNRLIVAARPPGLLPIFDEKTEEILPKIGSFVDKIILSGYQYLRETYPNGVTYREYISKAVKQIRLLKWPNTRARIHMEFASVRNEKIRAAILRELVPEVHSFGCNEVEILDVLRTLNLDAFADAIQKDESAWTLAQGAIAIAKELGLQRVHIHNLGYHVMYLSTSYPTTPEAARQGILYSSNIGTSRSMLGDFFTEHAPSFELQMGKQVAISYRGLRQLEKFAQIASQTWELDENQDVETIKKEGIVKRDTYYVLVIPAQIAPEPHATVGIGDSISSTAFIADGTPSNAPLRELIGYPFVFSTISSSSLPSSLSSSTSSSSSSSSSSISFKMSSR